MTISTSSEALPSSPSAGLLGRADAVAEGLRFLDALSLEPGPRALILGGAAGIGKTAVWRSVLDEARRRRLSTMVAAPSASEADLSFSALTDLLRDVDREVLTGLPSPQRVALGAAMLEGPAPDALAGAPSSDIRTIGSGLLGILRALAKEQPLIVAIDDVQWLDPGSRAVVAFAARRLGDARIGFLLAIRDDVGESALDLGRTLSDDRIAAEPLGPLSAAVLFQLLRSRLGHAFGRPTLIRIAQWSGGNPLLALEIGRAIQRVGGVIDPAAPPPVPRELARALAERLERLSQGERRLLLVAASAPRPTEARVLAACGRLGWHAAMPRDQSLLVSERGVLRFGHPMVAAQSLAIASAEDRRAAQHALAALAEDPEERARHLALGAIGPDSTVATALDEAARRAERRGALEAAIELAEFAVRLTPERELMSLVIRRRTLSELLLRAGETARARDTLDLAARDAPAGRERALVEVVLAEALIQSGSMAEARARCEAALEDSGSEPIVQARVQLAWDRASSDAVEGLAHARAARALLEPGPASLRARALADIASWLSRLGEAVPDELLDEAVELEASAPPARVIEGARATRGWLLLMADELDRAHAEYDVLREQADALGDESSLARILVEMAQIDLRAGRWDELAAHAEEAIIVAERAGREHDRAMAAIQLGALAAARGEADRGTRYLDSADAFGIAAGDPMIRAIVAGNRAVVALIEGDFGRADEQFKIGERWLADAHLGDEALMRYQADRIEVLVELGRLEEADDLARAIAGRAAGNRRRRPMAFVARGLGFIAAARGDLDAALESFDRSYTALAELGMRFEAARSLLARGLTNRRLRRKRLAHDDLQAALDTFEALAATAWIRRTRSELARVGLRPSAPTALTETESTVAHLAAAGRTNAEVAAAAFMSARTVEGVLARVYAKLGIRSRAELGRAMADAARLQPTERNRD